MALPLARTAPRLGLSLETTRSSTDARSKDSQMEKRRACSLNVTAHADRQTPLRSGLAHPDADAVGGRHPKGECSRA